MSETSMLIGTVHECIVNDDGSAILWIQELTPLVKVVVNDWNIAIRDKNALTVDGALCFAEGVFSDENERRLEASSLTITNESFKTLGDVCKHQSSIGQRRKPRKGISDN